ncbi:3'-5' exonuclease [Streptomyces sp. E2N171]|uniref:3'-5' exonuclease n=1 Tax=Streptomyces sp. E2N171 TaxID=1851914 RepID=UPI001EE9274D|nr:3'-5' exonuclease [Streptomyces sp. E2N171]
MSRKRGVRPGAPGPPRGRLRHTLKLHGIDSVEIRSAGPNGSTGVHIGTMFRFKRLEYQRVIIACVTDGLVPREDVSRLRDREPTRYRHEMQRARSLLFVAATRARDSVDVFWHGRPSPFLDSSWVKTEHGGR